MKTLTAIALTQETLEETCLKMMKANREECLKDIEKATDKFMKKALKLRTKAFNHIEENMNEVVNLVEFTLNK